jgi:hypothetical protein
MILQAVSPRVADLEKRSCVTFKQKDRTMATALAQDSNQRRSIGYSLPVRSDPTPPRRIIFKEIDIVPGKTVNDYPINLVYLPKNANDPPEDDLDNFIARVIDRPTSRAVGLIDSVSPLDLTCSEDCFIIFKLADTWNWQFQPEGDAFTTKQDEGEKYFNLVHVKKVAGQVVKYPATESPGQSCKLLYFRARGTTTGYEDPFNLIVELVLGTDGLGNPRRTKLVIDPDIRYPGQ